MECIAPHEIKEGDLLAYVEDAAAVPQRVRDHIARCPACAAQVKALAQVDCALQEHLFRAACPPPDDLLNYVTAMLPPDARAVVARHVADCPHCAADVRALEEAGKTAPGPDLWQQVTRLARALIEAIPVPPRRELAAALRGAPQPMRLFRAGDLDIALDIVLSKAQDGKRREGEPAFDVRGRVMQRGRPAPQVVGRAAYLVQQERVVVYQTVDDLGYFLFEAVPAGEYDVVLEQADADVVVRGIKIARGE